MATDKLNREVVEEWLNRVVNAKRFLRNSAHELSGFGISVCSSHENSYHIFKGIKKIANALGVKELSIEVMPDSTGVEYTRVSFMYKDIEVFELISKEDEEEELWN